MAGPQITFDTGALIALERRTKRLRELANLARNGEVVITVPAVVLTEWWTGVGSQQTRLLQGVVVEPTSRRIAETAGAAMRATRGASSVDAIVMASAALRGDHVWTSDLEDLARLQSYFPGVRLLRA